TLSPCTTLFRSEIEHDGRSLEVDARRPLEGFVEMLFSARIIVRPGAPIPPADALIANANETEAHVVGSGVCRTHRLQSWYPGVRTRPDVGEWQPTDDHRANKKKGENPERRRHDRSPSSSPQGTHWRRGKCLR